MKTYKTLDNNGDVYGFEIDYEYIEIRKIAKLLKCIDQVSDVRVRRLFSRSRPDIHIEFQYQNKAFVVWEPFGDSSRLWIGPEGKPCQVDMRPLESAFKNYQPPLITKLIAGFFTLFDYLIVSLPVFIFLWLFRRLK